MVNVIKLDHDRHAPRLSLREMVKRAKRANVELVAIGERRSPGGKGWHRWVIVRPAPKLPAEIVALQLLFGSDPYREAYCYNRAVQIARGRVRGYWARPDNWNVLYNSSEGKRTLWDASRATRFPRRCGQRT